MGVQILEIKPTNIDDLVDLQILPLGSTSGRSLSVTIEMVRFYAEDSSWSIVEWNRHDKADVENVDINFVGEADTITIVSSDHKKAFLGLKLNAKNTETDSLISVIATIKD